jgi:uncharacterized protein (DUF302 family)
MLSVHVVLHRDRHDRIRVWRSFLTMACLVVVALLSGGMPALASDAVMYVRRGASYQDVRLDLEAAIIAEGLKIDLVGDIGGMLKRTGPDVGSNVPVYKNAEFFAFCSAKLSRAMMERDPANMAQCPYVVFLYQREATLKEVTVGYRKLKVEGRAAKTLEEINKMLDRIVKKATK